MRVYMLFFLLLCHLAVGCMYTSKDEALIVDISKKNIKKILELYDVSPEDVSYQGSPPCVLSSISFNANTNYDIALYVHNADYNLRFNMSKLCRWNLSDFISLVPSSIKLRKRSEVFDIDFDPKLVPIFKH